MIHPYVHEPDFLKPYYVFNNTNDSIEITFDVIMVRSKEDKLIPEIGPLNGNFLSIESTRTVIF
ncbi:hypothetical protein CUJ83_04205 [Methanocella sp. CWC-04]|uniref:Uncharacterized protein n=1 Tax=Methanooceanicella nereidis TaxID=2052831 RepID=A0AAP2RDF6_9EURY|nr:hypothetical protein [Methanocella sp. CWC-04]